MKFKLILFFVLFTALFRKDIGSVSFSQNRNIDTLLIRIKTSQPDTSRVKHLNKLSLEYSSIGEYDKGLTSANDALTLASNISINSKGGWTHGIISAYNTIGNIHWKKGDYTEALKNHFLALKISEETGNKKGIAAAYNNIGNIYYSQSNYPKAMKNYFDALKIKELIKDKPGIAASYNNLGSIYTIQNNFPEALKCFLTSLKIRKEINDKRGISSCYNNLGNIYTKQGDYTQALKNFYDVLKINEEAGVKLEVGRIYVNIANIYTLQGESSKALKYYIHSLRIMEEIGDKAGIANSYNELGSLYTKLNNLKDARNYRKKALKTGIEIGDKEQIKSSYNGLALLDSIQDNWKDAYYHHRMFIVYRDSIDNEETKKKIIEATMTDKFEKQELETKTKQDKKDAIEEIEKRKQKIILGAVAIGLVIVLVFAGFIVRSLRITKRQKDIIEMQKNEVSKQKEIVLEKNKEITDSINYAQRIQRSLLASDKMLNANLINPSKPALEPQTLKYVNKRDYFIFFQPKDIVSGDFYWASLLTNGNFALVTADSTGHGVPGAIMSMLNISCLNEAVKGQQLTAPNEILNYTRSKIIEHLSNDGSEEGGKDGMDCSLISLKFPSAQELDEGAILTYSAANNPVWIVRKNEIIELRGDKMPVGKHDRDTISFSQHTIQLQKDDVIYTITDGFPDQFGGPKGKKYMSKQLKELLVSLSDLPMDRQKERLSQEFNRWKGNLEQVDDVCVIGIKV
ncbi:MAG: tetratricopeptide repeat protein [Bacteroidota bacterium]